MALSDWFMLKLLHFEHVRLICLLSILVDSTSWMLVN